MKTIAEILRTKGAEVYVIAPEATAYEAVVMMESKCVGALLVMKDAQLAGVISERDILRRLIQPRKAAEQVKVGEIMTREVIHVKPTLLITEAMAIMTEKRVRHLPVLENGKLCGMISLGDLVKVTIAEQEFLIHELEHYITSEHG
jgi:CBS domain-containing protein